MTKIDIFYTHFAQPFLPAKWHLYWQQLPENLQQKINRYRRWQDQHASLLSYLLLRKVLMLRGYHQDYLTQLRQETHGRPFIDNIIDFNISHSGEYVVCAIASHIRLGIDIELIRPIEVMDFKNYMTSYQWQDITQPTISCEKFFDYWTIKESVMKADGRGLLIPLVDIHTQGNQAMVEDKIWFIQKILLSATYSCHLATNEVDCQTQIHSVVF